MPETIAASAAFSAKKLGATAIVCLTTSGRTAQLIAKHRPKARILAVTHLLSTLNRLELVWGIQTLSIRPYKSTEEAMAQIESLLLTYDLVERGDRMVLTLGAPVQQGAKTNSLRVYTIGDSGGGAPPSQARPLRCK